MSLLTCPVSGRTSGIVNAFRLLVGIGLLQSLALSGTAAEPWVGELGVTETTAQIMERQEGYQRPPRVPWKVPRHRPRGHINFGNLLDGAGSPEYTGNEGAAGPVESAFSTSLSFTGATLSDTLAFPPDSMGAVGPSQYIVAVNGRIRSFNKTNGVADGVLNANPDVFFDSVLTPPVETNFTSDPRVRYDRLSGRWFLVMIDVPQQTGTFPNRIIFAVSDGAVITASTVWTFFQFRHDQPTPTSNSDNGKFADYPTLGIDANALYIGVNIFATRGQGSFSSTTAFVVRKSSILGAGPIVVTPFRDLIENNPNISGPYTPQGVDNYDPAATEGYFIGVDANYYGRLSLMHVSDPGGSPTISQNNIIVVPATGGTIRVPHLGNTNGTAGYLDGLDYRLLAAHVRNGKLWTAANLAVDNTGSPSGTDTRMGIRWYELGGIATGQTPTVLQAGTLFQPSGANASDQRSYWMGSIMVSGQGHALMGFSVAGANEYVNAGYAVRQVGDPVGTLRTPVLYTTSTSAYNPPSNPGTSTRPRRWGDYSYTSLDPDDDMTMWTIQEWCQASNSYAVQVVKVLAPPPATAFSVSPTSVTRGETNINLTVLGSVTDGSGFFDPGAGFPRRIAAAVAGTGVTVNGVTYHSPTNITLNVSVAGNAPLGTRAITVTNPDGQSAASAGGLLDILDAGSNSPPSLTLISNQVVDEGTLLTFAASGSDPDGQPLTYSLDPGAPTGAAIDSGTGTFTWTPTEDQGPTTNSITVRVTDSGTPPLDASRTFTVTVNEVNLAPSVAAVSNRIVHAGTVLIITNVASDLDLPANQLAFTLDPGAPAGAAVDPTTGIFTWATTGADAFSTNTVTVRVTDDGVPPLDGSAAFNIVVMPGPEVRSITMTNNQLTLLWNAIDGQTYRVQYKLEMSDPSWIDLPGDITATGETATKEDDTAGLDKRVYRVTVRY